MMTNSNFYPYFINSFGWINRLFSALFLFNFTKQILDKMKQSFYGFWSALALLLILPLAAAAQKTDPVYGQLIGVVKDAFDTPIEGASVYLESTDYGTVTDEKGRFVLRQIPPNSYNLIISFLGYQNVVLPNTIVRSQGNAPLSITLQESAQTLEEVTLTQWNSSRNRESPLSTQTLSAVELANYPGGNNDVVRVAQSLPGVAPSPGGFRNDLIIRGGAPNETVFYLDGMEIPNINHFSTQGSSGGPVGMLNVSFIQQVTLNTSAFGAQYDNPLSGVLQFEQRNGDSERARTNIRVSASDAALTTEGPLGSKTTYIASVRRSYLQFLFALIGLPIRPNYWDYQFKVRHEIDAYNELVFLGLGSIDDFSVEAPEVYAADQEATLEQVPYIEQNTQTFGVTWKHRSPSGSAQTLVTLSQNTLDNTFSRFRDNVTRTGLVFENQSKEQETKVRLQRSVRQGAWTLKSGAHLQQSLYTNNTNSIYFNNAYNADIDFLKWGFWGQASRQLFSDQLGVTIGLRADDDTFLSGSSIVSTLSPRASARLNLGNGRTLNASAGRYFKLPTYTALGFQSTTGAYAHQESARYLRSDHLVLGLEQALSPSALVTLEGFYKKYHNYPISLRDGVSIANKGAGFEVLGNEPLAFTGNGNTYGLELLLQQRLVDRLYGIMSYTYFFSEFSGLDGVLRPSTWDSRHLLSATAGLKLNRNWEVSGRFRYAGTTPYAPVDVERSLSSYPELQLDYTHLGDQRLGSFAQLDVRIDKRWNARAFAFNLFIEIQNALGRSTPEPTQYGLLRTDQGELITPAQLSAIPAQEGSLIPSIGLVLDF
jgi:hypothetical protein